MKTRTTLLLLVVFIALAAYIKFYESKGPNTAEATQQAQKVVTFERDNIDGIIIHNGDDKVELKRQDRKWRIETPFKDQADATAIENLLTDLENWPKQGTITADEIAKDKTRLDEFGLTRPKLRLKLNGKDAPPEVLLGNDSAFEGKVYVRLANTDAVFLATQSIRNDIAKKPEEFRDKKLTDLSIGQITRALLKTPTGEMELEKKGDHWEIVKPLRARGDDQKIVDLLAQVTSARIEQFIAGDQGDLNPYGLAEPRGSITLATAEDKNGQLLQIGHLSEKNSDQVYVRFAARNAVYTLPKKIEELLSTKPSDLRDRHLVRLDTDILDRITIDAGTDKKTVLARKQEKWTIASRNDQPANSGEIKRLLDRFQSEQVTKFVDDVASDLPKYGLDKPSLQLTFSSFASENTAETTAGEHPIATVAFGKTEGDETYARLGDEPFIVAVKNTFSEDVFTDPRQWQDTTIFRFKPDDISKVTIATDRESALVRNPAKEWSWVNGTEPINQTNVRSILNTISNLRAVRWAGATTPAHGLDQPQVTISFTAAPEEKKTHKLVVGGSTGDGMSFARTDEHDGTFVLSKPDADTLLLPLVANATGSPGAGATISATPSR